MIYLFTGWCLGWLVTFPIMSACNSVVPGEEGEYVEDFVGLGLVSLFLWPVFWAMLAWGLFLYLKEK